MLDSEKEVELVVGTYEDYVVGYKVETIVPKKIHVNGTPRKKVKTDDSTDDDISNKTKACTTTPRLSLEQTFAIRGHSGSVKSLTCNFNGSLVFSVGHDEMMNLFNLRRRKLVHTSEGAANCTTFIQNSHLICGSEDSNVYIYECKGSGMSLVKTLKGHKAAVISIDAHPSGKVLLSLSKDKTMRTWNLIKGKSAYVTNINPDTHLVKWSKTGDKFILAANNEIYLYDNESGKLVQSIKLEKRINSIEYINDDIFAIALDSGTLEFFTIREDKIISAAKLVAHETRIKSIKSLLVGTSSEDSKTLSNHMVRLATASSDGVVKLWSIFDGSSQIISPQELASVDLGTRVTCLVAAVRDPA